MYFYLYSIKIQSWSGGLWISGHTLEIYIFIHLIAEWNFNVIPTISSEGSGSFESKELNFHFKLTQ